MCSVQSTISKGIDRVTIVLRQYRTKMCKLFLNNGTN